MPGEAASAHADRLCTSVSAFAWSARAPRFVLRLHSQLSHVQHVLLEVIEHVSCTPICVYCFSCPAVSGVVKGLYSAVDVSIGCHRALQYYCYVAWNPQDPI